MYIFVLHFPQKTTLVSSIDVSSFGSFIFYKEGNLEKVLNIFLALPIVAFASFILF